MTQPPAIAAQPPGKAWHSQAAEEVLAQLGTTATGLSATEAAQRLTTNGPNELKEGRRITSTSPSWFRFHSASKFGAITTLSSPVS